MHSVCSIECQSMVVLHMSWSHTAQEISFVFKCSVLFLSVRSDLSMTLLAFLLNLVKTHLEHSYSNLIVRGESFLQFSLVFIIIHNS